MVNNENRCSESAKKLKVSCTQKSKMISSCISALNAQKQSFWHAKNQRFLSRTEYYDSVAYRDFQIACYRPKGRGIKPPSLARNKNNGLAITGLVLGIIGIILIWVPILNLILGIAALVFGIIGLKKSNQIKNYGKAISITGIVLGGITILAGLLSIIGVITYFGVLNSTEILKSEKNYVGETDDSEIIINPKGVIDPEINPEKTIQNQCAITSGFSCRDFTITTNNVKIEIANNMGQKIVFNDGILTSTEKRQLGTCTVEPNEIENENTAIISCNLNEMLNAGEKSTLNFELIYKTKTIDLEREASGKITGTFN
ncbi:DUF4190 domain-containing protein [Candidatus Woesearchaeota archaeon]|nr:DUF4190 domain-containing protein [Candidatus Woesearchaeota archaeon]